MKMYLNSHLKLIEIQELNLNEITSHLNKSVLFSLNDHLIRNKMYLKSTIHLKSNACDVKSNVKLYGQLNYI